MTYTLSKDRQGRPRAVDATLFGGWPGALIGQSALRHKSRKQPFQAIFWLTVIVNCAVLAWLSTPGGRAIIG